MTKGKSFTLFFEATLQRSGHQFRDSWITYTNPAAVDGNNYVFASKSTAYVHVLKVFGIWWILIFNKYLGTGWVV